MIIKEKIRKIVGTIWVVILVFLWVAYPFFPGGIFFWMWLAINWSILGGVIGAIIFMESQKYEIIIGIIWIAVLVLLWIFYPFLGGDTLAWMWTVVFWSMVGNALYIGLFLLKK